jgi:hypothetical protein
VVYLVYGVTVDSDLELDVPRVDEAGSLLVRARPGPVDDATVSWIDGAEAPWSCGRLHDGSFVLRYGPDTEMVVEASGASVDWWSAIPPTATLVHLVLDHGLPQAMMRRGLLVLHASCLVTPGGRCFALAGRSGQGKSTLAGALIERRHRFLADDCAVIELGAGPPLVAAAYPGLRLHETDRPLAIPAGTHRAGLVTDEGPKLRLALTDEASWDGWRRELLDTVVVLAPAPLAPPGVRRLRPAEAVISLLGHSFHLSGPAERMDVIGRVSALVDACPVIELHYEHSAEGLAATLACLDQLLAAPPR